MRAPDYAIDVAKSGQIILYTNLMETDNDQYIQWKDKGESNE